MIQLRRQLKTQARCAYSREEESGMSNLQRAGIPTPRQVKRNLHLRANASESIFQLVKYLDQFVVGQSTAKKVLSVA